MDSFLLICYSFHHFSFTSAIYPPILKDIYPAFITAQTVYTSEIQAQLQKNQAMMLSMNIRIHENGFGVPGSIPYFRWLGSPAS